MAYLGVRTTGDNWGGREERKEYSRLVRRAMARTEGVEQLHELELGMPIRGGERRPRKSRRRPLTETARLRRLADVHRGLQRWLGQPAKDCPCETCKEGRAVKARELGSAQQERAERQARWERWVRKHGEV
jgi:hypothetical protein